MTEKLFHVGIKALVQDEAGKILLLKADVSSHKKNIKPYWDIPGGRIQQGQNVLEALKREVEEEIGVSQIKDAEFFTAVVSNHEIPISDKQSVGLVLMIYKVVLPKNSQIALSPEHTEYRWTKPAEAANLLSQKYPVEFTDKIRL